MSYWLTRGTAEINQTHLCSRGQLMNLSVWPLCDLNHDFQLNKANLYVTPNVCNPDKILVSDRISSFPGLHGFQSTFNITCFPYYKNTVRWVMIARHYLWSDSSIYISIPIPIHLKLPDIYVSYYSTCYFFIHNEKKMNF